MFGYIRNMFKVSREKGVSKTPLRKIGDTGEKIASRHLRNNGYTILDINYLKPWGELDIVATKNNIIHFVEVKTISVKRGEKEDYDPLFNINTNKKERLRRIIQTYLKDKSREDADYQVDAIAVYLMGGKLHEVEHLEDILL